MRRWHVLAILVFLIGGYFLTWFILPTRDINMLVVDKTVPEPDFREHRAIFWVTEHRRFTDAEGDFYRTDRDYLGYHPHSEKKEILKADDLQDIDLLYLADTYGIYDYEEGLVEYEERLPFEHQDIDLIYGGFDRQEVAAITDYASEEGRIIIGEHNILGYPTYLEPEAAAGLEDLFAVNYEGWLVRYYADLNETAFWMKELYTRIYGREWDLSGTGMVFVREDVTGLGWYTDMVIIEQDQFNAPWPVVTSTDHPLLDGATSQAPYLYWVELLNVNVQDEDTEILAYYDLPVGEDARSALRTRGLPERFPAMIRHAPPGKAERIYFAGDFADQLPALLPPWLTGSAGLQRFFSYLPGLPVEYRFYFQWYEPILGNILKNTETGE